MSSSSTAAVGRLDARCEDVVEGDGVFVIGADATLDDPDAIEVGREGEDGTYLSAAASGSRSDDMDMLPDDEEDLAFALAFEEWRPSEE